MGLVVPMATLPPVSYSKELVIPLPPAINLVIYPPLDAIARTPVAYTDDASVGFPQLARPTASEMSTFPAHGDPHDILIVPLTSSFAHGTAVPIPTLVLLS